MVLSNVLVKKEPDLKKREAIYQSLIIYFGFIHYQVEALENTHEHTEEQLTKSLDDLFLYLIPVITDNPPPHEFLHSYILGRINIFFQAHGLMGAEKTQEQCAEETIELLAQLLIDHFKVLLAGWAVKKQAAQNFINHEQLLLENIPQHVVNYFLQILYEKFQSQPAITGGTDNPG